MKSSSGHIIINNINRNKEIKDNNINTIQLSTRKSSNNIRMNLNNVNKFGSIQANRIFLKKHIVIESKNKNIANDTRKNNNSISSYHNKNNIEGSNGNNYINSNYMSNDGNILNNNINLQINDKNNNLNELDQINNYQNIFNGVKYKPKNLVLKEVINNNDF